MAIREALRGGLVPLLVVGLVVGWAGAVGLIVRSGDSALAGDASNVGLALISAAVAITALARARSAAHVARFWWLLGAGCLSWSIGQAVATYASIAGRSAPFPSTADVGRLSFAPFAALALLSLPLAAPSLAGRLRVALDGLIVAFSLLLVSWVALLRPLASAGTDGGIAQAISLSYPASDVVVITIVIVTWLRARQSARRPRISLPLVGWGLLFFAIADSGFVYVATSGGDAPASLIGLGWLAGFALLLLAALRGTNASSQPQEEAMIRRQIGAFLPYSAVLIAVATSFMDMVRSGGSDAFISWDRSALMIFLLLRQILTLRENLALTTNLEQTVEERTAELLSSRQRFAALVQHSSDVVTVIDRDGIITYQSESSERVLGRPAPSMVGEALWDFMRDAQAADLRTAIASVSHTPLRQQTLASAWRRLDGRECHLEVTVTNLLENEHVGGLVLNSRDVTDRTALEDQLLHQAFHDSLTALFNRAMFKDRLEHALNRRRRHGGGLGVLFLDLDGFKLVNDTLGHSSGDALLVEVAGRLLNLVRAGDTVARLGGDEFAILVENLDDPDYTGALARRVNDALSEPYDLDGTIVHLSASVGIAHDDHLGADAEQLLRNADLAMYQAKGTTSGGSAVYDPSMHAGLVERVQLERDLRGALDAGSLALHYQPLVSMSTGRVTGVEALARWEHPDRGAVAPQEFISLAESTGLIRRLGLWVVREACSQVAGWQRLHPSLGDLKVSVNVSPRQLEDERLTEHVASVLEETRMRPELLTLEMTESVLMSDSAHALENLGQLRRLGVRLAIDDFGTGYSSLSYLHRFPVDVLKIDRSFIDELSRGADAALVSAIVKLGHSMNLETVAEGIERHEELILLRHQGCTTGQGYHFSPPMPAAELLDFLWKRMPLTLVRELA